MINRVNIVTLINCCFTIL